MNDELRAVALTLVDVAELFCKVGARHTLPLTGCNVRKGSLTAEEFAAKRGHAQKK